MFRLRTAIVLLALCHSLPARSDAEELVTTGSAPELDRLVMEAVERSPAIAAARATVAAKREMESPAGALPDPMVETNWQNVGFEPTVGQEDMSMVGVEARQALPYPGKRAAARALAAAETVAEGVALAALERQVEAEVRTLYAEVFALDQERESLAAASELVDLLEEVAHGRLSAGEGGQEGVYKAQLERQRLAERAGDLASERAALVAELNRWLDRPGDASLGQVVELQELPPLSDDAETLAVEGSLEVARAVAEYRLSERRVQVARLHLKPDFSAGAGLASRGGLDPVVTLRFGVELPLWRRQKHHPMIHAAAYETEAAADALADAQAQVRAEAARLRSAWANADQQVTRYREGIVPLTGAALDAARSAYLSGSGSFSTLVEDFGLWLDARVSLARREADRFIARVAFERLAGSGRSSATAKE